MVGRNQPGAKEEEALPTTGQGSSPTTKWSRGHLNPLQTSLATCGNTKTAAHSGSGGQRGSVKPAENRRKRGWHSQPLSLLPLPTGGTPDDLEPSLPPGSGYPARRAGHHRRAADHRRPHRGDRRPAVRLPRRPVRRGLPCHSAGCAGATLPFAPIGADGQEQFPPAGPYPQPQQAPVRSKKKRTGWKIAAIAVAAVVGLGIVGSLADSGTSTPTVTTIEPQSTVEEPHDHHRIYRGRARVHRHRWRGPRRRSDVRGQERRTRAGHDRRRVPERQAAWSVRPCSPHRHEPQQRGRVVHRQRAGSRGPEGPETRGRQRGAGIYLPDNETRLEDITPGNSVNGTVIFDIPKDAEPVAVKLHDSMFSNGVSVDVTEGDRCSSEPTQVPSPRPQVLPSLVARYGTGRDRQAARGRMRELVRRVAGYLAGGSRAVAVRWLPHRT